MADKSTSSSRGLGLGGAVFIVFLVLKLCGIITWSWWWVTAPLWGTAALVVLIFLAALAIGLALKR